MLSLKVDNQASLLSPVFSDWGLSSSLGVFVDEASKKRATLEETNYHNNTVSFIVPSAQMAAYTPLEDKVYLNETENLFAVFDGHGGGIYITPFFSPFYSPFIVSYL